MKGEITMNGMRAKYNRLAKKLTTIEHKRHKAEQIYTKAGREKEKEFIKSLSWIERIKYLWNL